jgi:hypothetical protein
MKGRGAMILPGTQAGTGNELGIRSKRHRRAHLPPLSSLQPMVAYGGEQYKLKSAGDAQ